MPDLLLELFSEEIPARMQRKAAEDLRKLVTNALVERGFLYEGAKAFATPRRLALHVAGLPLKGQDVVEEKKGPRIDAPPAAIQGFLKSAGLGDVSQAAIVDDPKKGSFYIAKTSKPGRLTNEVLAEIIPDVIRSFPWPKSMRWGAASAQPGSLKWVRPLQSILCTFGPETEEPEVVPFEVGGIRSGNVTFGHRFHAPAAIAVRRFDDYVSSLEKAHVILDAERRKDIILNEARTLAFAQGLELIEDEGLAEEVAGLVEWPVVLMGSFDADFLTIPPEVIRATIRANQKCFVVRGASTSPMRGEVGPQGREGVRQTLQSHPIIHPTPSLRADPPPQGEGEDRSQLAPRFILTANIAASDGGKQIIAGNERVVRARLSDARHFWQTDRASLPDLAGLEESAKALELELTKPLDQRMAKLDRLGVVFHQKLGSQGERVQRIVALARELALVVGKDLPEAERQELVKNAARAALLAKADLTSEMVGEFPELQGLIGRYYGELQGEHPSVCAAIEEHYKPLGPTDRVPTDLVSVTVALADKLDTLVGFWAIDEKPTGSKDPYALRRAALGVIRLVLENGVRVGFTPLFNLLLAIRSSIERRIAGYQEAENIAIAAVRTGRNDLMEIAQSLTGGPLPPLQVYHADRVRSADLLSFFHDRLKVQLREQGVRHDLVEAVLAGGGASPSPRASGGEGLGVGGGAASPILEAQAQPPPTLTLPTASGGRENPGSSHTPDDLVLIVARVKALAAFLATEDGVNLVAGYRRAANILKDEEKKDGAGVFDVAPDAAITSRSGPQDAALNAALDVATASASQCVAREDFAGAMTALAALRVPVDAFFEAVRVNDDDPAVRVNRLRLLAQLRRATRTVADFGRIAG